MRDLTVDMSAHIVAPKLSDILMAYFDFESAPVRFWTGYGDIVWAGDTYVGAGDIGSVSDIEEAAEIASKGTSFTLSGIPTAILALALQDNYQQRPCKLWLGALDSAGVVVVSPYQIFSGRMDTISLEEGGETSNMTLTAENRLVDLRRSRERRWTDADQRIDFPDDEGFKFVNALQDKQLRWGQGYTPTATPSGNNGYGGNGSVNGRIPL